jgi:hypothetical protein
MIDLAAKDIGSASTWDLASIEGDSELLEDQRVSNRKSVQADPKCSNEDQVTT